MGIKEIEKRIKRLPRHLIPEVVDYIDFLMSKHASPDQGEGSQTGFQFNWEGGISALKEKYSSVDLQHKALDWR